MQTQLTNKRLSFWLILLTALALALALGACTANTTGNTEPAAPPAEPTQPADETPATPAISLPGTDWDLVSYGPADAPQTPAEDTRPTLSFTANGISGSTGCNSFFGDYTLEGTDLSVGMLGSTEMFCEGLMDQEATIMQMLQEAQSISADAEGLTIYTAQGEMVFQPPVNQTLAGVDWVLSGIADTEKEAVVSTWIDGEITAVFAEGQMSGSAGCNNYFASYETDGEKLTLGPVGSTKKLCDEEHNAREMEFLTALQNVTGYTISRDSLTLTDAAGNGLLFFQTQPEQ